MPERPWPGAGAILAAIETASGRTAEVVGKPSDRLFVTALERLGEGRTLVVGDRLDADVAGAGAAGLDAALVLSGDGSGGGEPAVDKPEPVQVAGTLAELVLAEARA